MNATRPDHASPWVFDTRALGRQPGSLKRFRVTAPVDEPIGVGVVRVPAGSEIVLEAQVEAVSEGVLATGEARATAEAECSRCLTEIEVPVVARLRDLYAYPGSTTDRTTDDDELPRVVDDLVDLRPLVRDEIVLALPVVPLCRPDCRGLCPMCGDRLEDLEHGHSHEILDPRWAALRDRFDTGRDIDPPTGRPPAGPVPTTADVAEVIEER